MNKIILIPILIVIIIAISVSLYSFSQTTQPEVQSTSYEIDFTFYDVEKIKSTLSLHGIIMSSPTAITDHTIKQYCTFFDDEHIRRTVDYCTTTALVNSDGNAIGNVNLGGTTDGPTMALAILDSSPFLNSNENDVKTVFQTMIETLVCDCWERQKPGGFETVTAWIDAAQEKYVESSKTTLKSEISGLDNKKLILEITSTSESYLWTLIILK
ncbi:MAG: hypothetical protein ACE5DU_04010 [Nitrosopumilus sp.]